MNIIFSPKNAASLINVSGIFCPHSAFLFRSRINTTPQMFPGTLCSLFLLVCGLLLPASGWAWEVKTHKELTEEAIKSIEGDLNTYLVENLGLEGGLGGAIEGGTPREVMIQGSNTEDNFPRFINHFHEPIANRGAESLLGISSIDWSLADLGSQFPGGAWSWNDAREYYFKALTSETKKDRDKYWGKTFRALGQVMHLLQDSANPSHVRDDFHPFDEGLHDYMARHPVGSYLGGGIFSPDPTLLEVEGKVRNEPFSNLFDHNVNDDGLNPSATLGGQVGVAEYANANFFSDDTIPGQNSTVLVYPNLPELVPAPTVPFGPQYLTLPRLGSSSELKARVAKFTGTQSFSKFRLAGLQLDLLNQLRLDDLVYEAYSINLIPRAVGYAAAVLDYFFRGDIEVDEMETKFEVESGALGNNTTECTQTPLEEFGLLNVEFTIPSTLNYSGDTPSIYYEQTDKTRLLAGATVPLAGIANPVRWYVVLKGPAGPGTQELEAVLAKTGLAQWEFFCDH